MEADLSHHPKYLANFIKKQMETGADIVTGTRYVKGGGVHGWNLMRKFEAKPPGFSVRRRQFSQFRGAERAMKVSRITCFLLLTILFAADSSRGIRFSGRMSKIPTTKGTANQQLQTAVFALGSFWRSEVVFGCLDGVVRTTVGYAGGSKPNPEYWSFGDHAESVQIEYDPRTINFKQLLEVFWTSHDSRQVFGQGPDVGNQYRSIIFTNGTEESRTAALSKEREQTK